MEDDISRLEAELEEKRRERDTIKSTLGGAWREAAAYEEVFSDEGRSDECMIFSLNAST